MIFSKIKLFMLLVYVRYNSQLMYSFISSSLDQWLGVQVTCQSLGNVKLGRLADVLPWYIIWGGKKKQPFSVQRATNQSSNLLLITNSCDLHTLSSLHFHWPIRSWDNTYSCLISIKHKLRGNSSSLQRIGCPINTDIFIVEQPFLLTNPIL